MFDGLQNLIWLSRSSIDYWKDLQCEKKINFSLNCLMTLRDKKIVGKSAKRLKMTERR